jgi:hypothetical protein
MIYVIFFLLILVRLILADDYDISQFVPVWWLYVWEICKED